MNIAELMRRQATERPDSAAIIECERTISFAQLDSWSYRLATVLREEDLTPGDVVLVFQPMSAELYVTLLAIFRLGGVAMFLDPSAGREHVEQCCRIGSPKMMIGSPKAQLLRLVSSAVRRIPVKLMVGGPTWWRAHRSSPWADIHPLSEDSPALLTFTSGSTGQPKAARRTQGFLIAQHKALQENLKLTAGEVDLATLPIFALANLASGVTSVIPDADLRFPGAIDPAPVVAQILKTEPSRTAASPAFLDRIAGYCVQNGTTLPSLRRVFTGGAPVFPRTMRKLQLVAPNAEIVAVYGSTEAEPIAHIALHEMANDDLDAMMRGKGLLVGLPVSCIQLKILRDQWGKPIGPFTRNEFGTKCCATDEVGEIVVSGEHVLTSYWQGRGDEETKFVTEGRRWHRTGDAGYLDARGRLWLLGRCSARIEDERGVLYPFAVECAASQLDSIHRTAVVLQKGMRLLAVEFAPGSDENAVQALRERLAWAHIDEFRVVKSIPVDIRHNAKVDYPALQKLLANSS